MTQLPHKKAPKRNPTFPTCPRSAPPSRSPTSSLAQSTTSCSLSPPPTLRPARKCPLPLRRPYHLSKPRSTPSCIALSMSYWPGRRNCYPSKRNQTSAPGTTTTRALALVSLRPLRCCRHLLARPSTPFFRAYTPSSSPPCPPVQISRLSSRKSPPACAACCSPISRNSRSTQLEALS